MVLLFLVGYYAHSQLVVYDEYAELEKNEYGNFHPDTTYVVNFWATWCKPCVKELPYFERLSKEYEIKKVKVLLISLDFKTQIETKLLPFIKENNILSKVVVLADGKENEWIDKVDPSWSGAIPITLMMKEGQRKFFEISYLDYQMLEEDLLNFIKN